MDKEKRKENNLDAMRNDGLAGAAGNTVDRYGEGIEEHLVACDGVDEEKRKKRNRDAMRNAGLAAAAGDTVSRYGAGIKEHLVGYDGVDPENGVRLKRSLKDTHNYKRDPNSPDYKSQTKQHAGFAAESKEVSRRRAEEAISGKKPKTKRTDDVPGHVNDELFDITCKVDKQGNPVPGSSAQMKFVGKSPKDAVGKMMSKKYEKYIDNDVKMIVPKDYYDGMQQELQDRIDKLDDQIAKVKDPAKRNELSAKQKKLKTLKKNLRKSKVTSKEAVEATLHPKLSTMKDIGRVAHRAGLEQAKMSAAIAGGMSIVRNFCAVVCGKKTPEEAAKAVAGDTGCAAAAGYVTSFAGSTIKGFMQKSASSSIRTFSKTNLPAAIVASTIELSKSLTSLFKGEITGVQCIEEIGENGFGMASGALCAGIGQILIPIPVVGAMAGSMIGYALSSASYRVLLDSLKEAKLARKERLRIEEECRQQVAMLKQFRAELEEAISAKLSQRHDFFLSVFDSIKNALEIGDVDGYISAANRITEQCGKKPLFRNAEECDALMMSADVIRL